MRARTRPVGCGPTRKECRRHGRIDLRGRWTSVARLTTEAGLAALKGRVDELAESYRAAIEAWRALDCTLDLAMCELDLVLLLSPDVPDATATKEAGLSSPRSERHRSWSDLTTLLTPAKRRSEPESLRSTCYLRLRSWQDNR